MSQDAPQVINDLSSNEPLSSYNQKLIAEDLREIQDRIRFKRWLFWGMGSGSILLLFMLLAYINLPIFLHPFEQRIPLPERLTIIGVLAAMTIVLPLALLRVIYLPTKAKEDSEDNVSIWQSLAKELLDILRKYVDNKSN